MPPALKSASVWMSPHTTSLSSSFITPLTCSKTVTYSKTCTAKITKYHTKVKIKAQKSASTLYSIRELNP